MTSIFVSIRFHILKNIVCAVRRSGEGVRTTGRRAKKRHIGTEKVLSFQELWNAAAMEPEVDAVLHALQRNVDPQNVPICQWVLMNPEIRERLEQNGCIRTYLVMRTLATFWEATSAPGIAATKREASLRQARVLVRGLLQARLRSASHHNRQYIGEQYVSNWKALLYLIDAHLYLYTVVGETYVPMALDNTDLETAFSILWQQFHGKALVQAMLQGMSHNEVLTLKKLSPDSSLKVVVSRKHKYSQQKLTAEKVSNYQEADDHAVHTWRKNVEYRALRALNHIRSNRGYATMRT